jgi:hypothetical protein
MKTAEVRGSHSNLIQVSDPYNTVTDLTNALPGNSSLNTDQHAIIEEAVFSVSAVTSHNSGQRTHDVFSVDETDAPTHWPCSDHVICIYCRPISIPRLLKGVTEFVQGSYQSVVSWRCESRRIFSSEVSE